MINPQFNPIGGLPNVPSTSELWKNEKPKYRQWMILFFIGIVSLFTLSVLSLVFNIIDLDKTTNVIISNSDNLNNTDFDAVRRLLINQTILPVSFQVAAYLVGVILFITSVIKSYKNKNFAFISSWSTLVISISAMLSFIDWILIRFDFSTLVSTGSGVFALTFQILSILIWLLISAPVVRIKRLFLVSYRVEMIKNSPEYKAMQQQFNGGVNNNDSPYGPSSTDRTNTNDNDGTIEPAEPIISPKEKKLRSLKVSELRKVAKQLSISGSEKMTKEELVNAILRVSE